MAVREIPSTLVPTVKVYAIKDHVKKNGFANPPAYRLNKEGIGWWPFDQFTKRRLRDGDVSLEEPQGAQQTEAQQQGEPQQQTAGVQSRRKVEPPKPESST